MTTTLKSNIHAEFGWTWQDQNGSTVTTNTNRLRAFRDLLNGSGSGQADQIWDNTEKTLASGSVTTLDLTSLDRNIFGTDISLSFALIKGLLIVNRNTTGTAYLKVGSASSNPWYAPLGTATDSLKIPTGGCLLLSHPDAGWSVTSSAKALKLEAVDGEVNYDIVILGVATT